MARDLGTKYVCYKMRHQVLRPEEAGARMPEVRADQRAGTSREGHFRPRRARGSAKAAEEAEVPATEDERGGDGRGGRRRGLEQISSPTAE